MPFTPPSIYAPGTVDLLSLIMQAKSGTAGLHKALTGQVSPIEQLDLGEGISPSSASVATGPITALITKLPIPLPSELPTVTDCAVPFPAATEAGLGLIPSPKSNCSIGET